MTPSTRKKLSGLVVFAILGVVLIAMVVTGFGTNGMGGIGGAGGPGAATGETAVRIGSEKISDAELQQRIAGFYRQEAEQNPTLDRAAWMDANFDAALDSYISERSLVAFARAQGFVVPEEMVAREIIKIPAFLNAAGDFDETLFRQALQRNQRTEQELRHEIEWIQLARMVAAPVSGNAVLPTTLANQYADLLLEKRVGWFGAVPTNILARGLNPTDAEVASFYAQNTNLFRLPERRVVRYVLFGREQFGDRVRATDQEIQSYYDSHAAEYGAKQTRNVQLFTAQDEAAARAFADRVNGGASFEDAARPAGFAPGDVNLPGLTQEQLTGRSDTNFANQVFAAETNRLVGPQRTESGFQVARVTGVVQTAGRPLAAVRSEIVTAIETRKLAEQLAAATDRIQTQLDDGASLDDVARAERLPVLETAPVTAAGVAQNLQFPRELLPLVQEAFEMNEGDAPHLAVVQPDISAAVITVGRVLPAAAPALAEISGEVRTRMINSIANQRARDLANQIVARINAGASPADAFRQVAANVPGPQSLTLQRTQVAQAGRQVPPHFRLLFTLPERRAHALPAPGGAGWVVVYNQQRIPGNAQTDPNGSQIASVTRRAIQDSGDEELRQQFARAVGAAIGIERNDAALAALRQSLRSGR